MSAGRGTGAGARSPPSRHAAQGGVCDGGIDGLDDAIAIADGIAQFGPDVTSLRVLQTEYSTALSQPSRSDELRAGVLTKVKTQATIAKILPILKNLFDG